VARLRRLSLWLLAALALAGCHAPTELEDVSYDDRFEEGKLDLYLPGDSGAHPTVMFIHGGAWRWGDKFHFANMARRLARSGWVAASINYRLVPEGEFPKAAQDCACALAFLQQNADQYDIDPNAIAVMGYSAGGHLSSLLGVAWDSDAIAPDCAAGRPSRPAAVIPGSGAHDLIARSDATWVQDFVGGTYDELPNKYHQASPIENIDGGEPPFLLITGGADWIGVDEQSRWMRDALRAKGNQAEELRLAGGGHLLQPGIDSGEIQFGTAVETPEAWLVLVDFLARTIGEP
jgi:acetyl esterase/lipase